MYGSLIQFGDLGMTDCSINSSDIWLEDMSSTEVFYSEAPATFIRSILISVYYRVSILVARPKSSVKTSDSPSGMKILSRCLQVLSLFLGGQGVYINMHQCVIFLKQESYRVQIPAINFNYKGAILFLCSYKINAEPKVSCTQNL